MKKLLITLTLAFGVAIATPSVANAQTTATSSEQTSECCKEKKTCTEGKACCKAEARQGCCKEGKAGKIKLKDMNKAKGRRNAGGPKEKAKMRRVAGENPMFKGITLTDAQQQKMKALREKNKASEKKVKAEMKAKSKDEMQKLRAEFDKEMETILDKDQFKQYQANKAEMEAKRAEKMNK